MPPDAPCVFEATMIFDTTTWSTWGKTWNSIPGGVLRGALQENLLEDRLTSTALVMRGILREDLASCFNCSLTP
jgi:hypothetical protein